MARHHEFDYLDLEKQRMAMESHQWLAHSHSVVQLMESLAPNTICWYERQHHEQCLKLSKEIIF